MKTRSSNSKLSKIVQHGNDLSSKLFEIRIWTVDDVAQFLDVTKGHIYNLVSRRDIPFRKRGKGGRLYFIPQEIFEWINEEIT